MPNVPQIDVDLQMQRSLSDGYRPHIQVGDGDYLGVSFFDVRVEEHQDKSHIAKAYLMYWPDVDYAPLKVGVQFKIKEGGKTVGVGTVTKGWERHAI